MSLVARCPHCSTTFRVEPSQLSVAGGWVRCGACGQAFEAETPPLQPLPDIDLELPDLEARPAEPEAHASTAAVVEPSSSRPADDPELSVPSAPSAPDLSATMGQAAPGPDPLHASPGDLRGDLAPSAVPSAPEATAPPAAQAPARRGPSVGWVALLFVLLLAHLAYALRGPVAQAWPESRPWLIQACGILGCQLPPLRSLQDLQLESSSLSFDDELGRHRLQVTLRNTGPLPLRIPALELTLTNGKSEVMARRVLLTDDLGLATDALAPQGEVPVKLTLDLSGLDAGAIASFRVQAFYP